MNRLKKLSVILICMILITGMTESVWALYTSGENGIHERGAVVTLETSGGIITKEASRSGTVILPTDKNGKGYTFLGWSTRRNQTSHPQYQAYEKIKVTRDIRLYPVRYRWNEEADVFVGNLAEEASRYSKIIFVGDSRTVMLKKTLISQYGTQILNKVSFVCKSGQGLDWMKECGEALLLDELEQQKKSKKPIAVIFNLGVNDLRHRPGTQIDYKAVAQRYTSYINRLIKKKNFKNCRLYYMSVNPCNTAMRPIRNEAEIRGFNKSLKMGLDSRFRWLDTFSYFMQHGYTTHCEIKGGTDDGLHYSMKTYKRIYAYVMKKL